MKQWYVMFAKPRKEHELRDRLVEQGIEVFFPLIRCSRAGMPDRLRPLFPRYLFARFDMAEIPVERIRWMPGLVTLVMFDGQYAVVGDEVIAFIEQRLASLEARRQAPFTRGQRVRFPDGHPFAKLEAVFDKPCSDAKRGYILLETLGRLTRCEVEMSLLEPVDGLAL